MTGRCANCKYRLATLRADMAYIGQRDLCHICWQALTSVGMDIRPVTERKPEWLRRSLAKDFSGGAA